MFIVYSGSVLLPGFYVQMPAIALLVRTRDSPVCLAGSDE